MGAVASQGLQVDGFGAHPAAVDVATHYGALLDTDPSAATAAGPPPAARVPVALGAYSVSAAAAQVSGLSHICEPLRHQQTLLQRPNCIRGPCRRVCVL